MRLKARGSEPLLDRWLAQLPPIESDIVSSIFSLALASCPPVSLWLRLLSDNGANLILACVSVCVFTGSPLPLVSALDDTTALARALVVLDTNVSRIN